MNKVEIGLTVVVIGIVFMMGCFVYWDMTTELEDHPEIKEFTGPDITNIGPMFSVVLVAGLVISIILWLHKDDKNIKS